MRDLGERRGRPGGSRWTDVEVLQAAAAAPAARPGPREERAHGQPDPGTGGQDDAPGLEERRQRRDEKSGEVVEPPDTADAEE